MNALEGECLCLRERSINVNNLLEVLLLAVLFICYFFMLILLLLVYFFITLFFILMLLLYFCLFVDQVNKRFIFLFGAFVYHFKNIIFIFVIASWFLDEWLMKLSWYQITWNPRAYNSPRKSCCLLWIKSWQCQLSVFNRDQYWPGHQNRPMITILLLLNYMICTAWPSPQLMLHWFKIMVVSR